MSKNYFIQTLKVIDSKKVDRFSFLLNFVKNKKILHVGFIDYPITNIEDNLHLKLSQFCLEIDGIDPNLNFEIKKILTVNNGNLYSRWEEIKDCYDVIIVPEVIEHVDNVRNFLEILDNFSGTLIITAPDAYLLKNNFQETTKENNFQEIVHPDHNYWFTPYTVYNVINKYSKNRKVVELHWIKGSIAAVCK